MPNGYNTQLKVVVVRQYSSLNLNLDKNRTLKGRKKYLKIILYGKGYHFSKNHMALYSFVFHDFHSRKSSFSRKWLPNLRWLRIKTSTLILKPGTAPMFDLSLCLIFQLLSFQSVRLVQNRFYKC